MSVEQTECNNFPPLFNAPEDRLESFLHFGHSDAMNKPAVCQNALKKSLPR